MTAVAQRPMRILVAGAAGFLGRSVVQAATRAGHEVRGLVRSEEQFSIVRSAGAQPVLGDVRVVETLADCLVKCDVLVHLATRSRGSVEEMRAARVDGCRSLISAAKAAGVRRVVIGSGYWLYRDNTGILTEESPIAAIGMPGVNFAAEEIARKAGATGAVETVIARPGMVYGDGSWFREMVEELRTGEYRYIGDGSSYWSPVALEDTGEAFRTLCERGVAGEIYLVVDDAPVSIRELANFVANQLDAPSPRNLSPEEAAREWGSEVAELVGASRRASNAKLKRLGWTPRFTNYRAGIPEVLRTMARPNVGAGDGHPSNTSR